MPRFDPLAPVARGMTLLEASAGTGKTYSITSLVLRLLVDEGLKIDQVLVVTYTEAATAELRDRIRGRIRDAHIAFASANTNGVTDSDDEVVADLVRAARTRGVDAVQEAEQRLHMALMRFDTAQISTIHGFCAGLLRANAFECGSDFDATMLKDPADLLEEIMLDFWARAMDTRSPAVVRSMTSMGVSVAALRELAKKAADDPTMEIVPRLDAINAGRGGGIEDSEARRAAAVKRFVEAWTAGREEVRRLLAGQWQANHLPARFAEVDAWVASPQPAELPEKLKYFRSTEVSKKVRRNTTAPRHPVFDRCEELYEATVVADKALGVEVLRLRHECVAWVRTEAEKRKRARRLQTYEDLLRQVQRALRDNANGPRLVAAVGGRIEAALIDEFQDTDGVQWDIFHTLFKSPEKYLVLIGDPKQAIYSFRGADINAYLAARRAVPNVADLDINWRSDAPLVQAVNGLFGRLEHPFAVKGIEYPPVRAQHEMERLSGDGQAPFRIRFLRRDGNLVPLGGPGVAKEQFRRVVVSDVARDVNAFLVTGAQIGDGNGEHRPVTPGDVAVLVRTNFQAMEIQEALRQHGIPSVRYGATSVFDTDEASDLAAILAAAMEPSNVRTVRRALATDLLGLAAAAELAEELEADVTSFGIGDLLAHLEEDEARLEQWLERFHSWRELLVWHGVMPMIRSLVDVAQLPRRLLAHDEGERRLTNLRHLAELLHSRATEADLSPATLLEWLRDQRTQADADEDAHQLRLESDADAVSIATIHRSKGLEYPVVWCPFLWDGSLVHPSDEAYVRFDDSKVSARPSRSLDIDTVGWSGKARADHEKSQLEAKYAENLRLMYVALTRARHRCTVYWGGVSGGECSPLAWLLHGRPETTPDAALASMQGTVKRGDDSLFDDIRKIAATSDGAIGVFDTLTDAGPRWSPAGRSASRLRAAEWSRTTELDPLWRIGSFTSLTRTAHASRQLNLGAEPQPEFIADARVPNGADAEATRLAGAQAGNGSDPFRSDEVPLASFPASAQVGIFFHELFETIDFQNVAAIDASVASALERHGLDARRWAPAVRGVVNSTLTAAITGDPGSFSLRGSNPKRRLTELHFDFPVWGGYAATTGAFGAQDLARAFTENPGGSAPASYGQALKGLPFAPLRGFLTGSIDLVVEHEERWYVIDYKSNLLGPTRQSYTAQRLQQEMADSHYILQYHLYVLALHRYLRWRVPGYDYDRHVGGAAYLFIRGLDQTDPASGIYFDRPTRERIEALDAAMSPLIAAGQ